MFELDRTDAIVPFDANPGHAFTRDACAFELAHETHAFRKITRRPDEAEDVWERRPDVERRLQHERRLDARANELRCEQQQERSASREHDAPLGNERLPTSTAICAAPQVSTPGSVQPGTASGLSMAPVASTICFAEMADAPAPVAK